MSKVFLVMAVLSSFLFAGIEKEKWEAIKFNDSLEVLHNGQHAGVLNSSLITADSVVELIVNLDMGTSLHEKRNYNFEGMLVSAEQVMISSSGRNSWKLFCESGEWTLLSLTGGVERQKKVSPVRESIGSLYEIYDGIINSSLEVGKSWNDTTFELISAEYVITNTVCREKPVKENGYNWILVSKNSVTGRDEIWKLDRNGKTVYREIYPFTARVSNIGSEGAAIEQANLVEAFKIWVKRRALTSERILLTFDSTFQLDSSVFCYYQKSGNGYMQKAEKQECGSLQTGDKLADSLLIHTLPTSTMQSDHPDIIRLSKSIQKNSDSLCVLVRMFNDTVYRMLKKRNTATFSSAVETLKSGFGDCGEHAVLLAALLRAAGIPARVVMGLVYMKSGRGYYYHAWVSAYTGQWVFADPSHGLFPADRDRIPLMIDDTGERYLQLSKLFGRIRIEYKRK